MEQKYNHASAELEVRTLWEKERIFAHEQNDKPVYSIDTPPPTVSGTIHIGHIFSYTQTDIIARFNRLKGYEVFYPFGFDDNGLPTERFVEKKRSVSAFSMGRPAFIKLCLEETHLVELQFKALWQAIGLSVDWELWYSTIAPNVRKISQESFIDLYNKGYVYRKNEPALYCTTCRTSVAQAELDDKEVNSVFNDIAFNITDGQRLTISTTRPELLASCVALLYHPSDTRYKNLDKQQAIVPLYGHHVRIITDETVDPQKGTGLVMCCTFGDKNDIMWYQKYRLEYRESVGRDGVWTPMTGILAGLRVHQARKKIIQALSDAGVLLNQRPITHSVNVHERCKEEIEYVILPQWFLKILEHKKELLALADRVDWFPAYMKTRYINWVENLGWDWCLSRQRYFGIPFPAWHCTGCHTTILAEISQLPLDPQETPYGKPCPHCGSSSIVADTDVMDTWNTSALTPYICCSLKNPTAPSVFDPAVVKNFLPMAMRPQAHDIIRTWAFYTLAKTWYHHKTTPWKSIVISGHVLSAKAEKISKSRDNAPTQPTDLITQWSADAIRFWTASAALGTDVAFSENQFKIGQRLVTKLWNACRFIGEHTVNVDATTTPKNFGPANEWLLHQATSAFNAYKKELENNEFSPAINHIERFFWRDLCDNYLEIVKDQLFKPENYTPEQVAATKWTLYWVGLRVLQLYAPFIPFVTEKIYQELYKESQKVPSIHKTLFSEIQHDYHFEHSAAVMETMLQVVSCVRQLKTANKLSLGTPLDELGIHTNDIQKRAHIDVHGDLLKGVCKAAIVTFTQTPVNSEITTQDGRYRMSINLDCVPG